MNKCRKKIPLFLPIWAQIPIEIAEISNSAKPADAEAVSEATSNEQTMAVTTVNHSGYFALTGMMLPFLVLWICPRHQL